MRTNHTFGVHFVLRTSRGKQGQGAIYARVTVNKQRCEIALKRSVSPADWQESKGLAKPKNDDLKFLNSYLEQVRGQLAACYQEIQLQKKLATVDAIKNKYLGIEEKEHTLCLLMDYHNTHMATILSYGTLKNYFTTAKYVREFIKEQYKKSDMFLREMDYKTICQFEYYLRIHKPKDEEKNTGIANNGVMKHLERFRKMIRLAVKMGWMEKNVFELYQLKFDKVERDFLTKEELEAIELKEFDIDRIQYVKDLFVFGCYNRSYHESGVLYTLHFKKGDQHEMYFLNKFDARLSGGKPEEDKTQTFYVNKGHGVTAKEAYNLLEGRSVYKELLNKEKEPYKAWIKLDFEQEKEKGNYKVKQFSEGFGYDLEKSLSRFPIKELGDPEQKEALLKSLQKGNMQQVNVDGLGKFYVEARPQFKTINVYDGQHKAIKRETLLEPPKKHNKKEQKNDQDQEQSQQKSRKRGGPKL